jgi:hypothetical protein
MRLPVVFFIVCRQTISLTCFDADEVDKVMDSGFDHGLVRRVLNLYKVQKSFCERMLH